MRAIWSQAVRPRVQGNPSTAIESGQGILSRRTTTVPLRRRLTFSDAFTVLLAPVLATAFVVDSEWKDNQRKEWDKKIAEVQQEIERLHAREVEAWTALQLRSASLGASHQLRHYSSASSALKPAEQIEEAFELPTWEEGEEEGIEQAVVADDAAAPHHALRADGSQWSSGMTADLHRYERLIAMKLAIELSLHLRTGKSPRFAATQQTPLDPGPDALPVDVNGMFEKLKAVSEELNSIRLPRHVVTTNPAPLSVEQRSLHLEISTLADDFHNGHVTVAELVEGFASKLLHSSAAPCTLTYTKLLRVFSQAEHENLAYYVIAAMKNGKAPLTSNAVYHILLQLGKSMDLRGFDRFLKDLSRSECHFNVRPSQWELWQTQGMQLPVPSSLEPRLLQVLVQTALKCDQPHRAEAWASILRDRKFRGSNKSLLCTSFLHYYASRSDWSKGKPWLDLCIQSAPSFADHGIARLQRVIVRMLDFCVACGKSPEYSMILNAAVSADISIPKPDRLRPQMFAPRIRSILDEWKSLSRQGATLQMSELEKACQFQDLLSDLSESPQSPTAKAAELPNHGQSPILELVTRYDQGPASTPMTGMIQQWNHLFQKQQQALAALKTELDQSKALYLSLEATNKRLSMAQPQLEQEIASLRRALRNAKTTGLGSMQSGKPAELSQETNQRPEHVHDSAEGRELSSRDGRLTEVQELRAELAELRRLISLESEPKAADVVAATRSESKARQTTNTANAGWSRRVVQILGHSSRTGLRKVPGDRELELAFEEMLAKPAPPSQALDESEPGRGPTAGEHLTEAENESMTARRTASGGGRGWIRTPRPDLQVKAWLLWARRNSNAAQAITQFVDDEIADTLTSAKLQHMPENKISALRESKQAELFYRLTCSLHSKTQEGKYPRDQTVRKQPLPTAEVEAESVLKALEWIKVKGVTERRKKQRTSGEIPSSQASRTLNEKTTGAQSLKVPQQNVTVRFTSWTPAPTTAASTATAAASNLVLEPVVPSENPS